MNSYQQHMVNQFQQTRGNQFAGGQMAGQFQGQQQGMNGQFTIHPGTGQMMGEVGHS